MNCNVAINTQNKRRHTKIMLLFFNATLLTDIVRILTNNVTVTNLFRNLIYVLIVLYIIIYTAKTNLSKDFIYLFIAFTGLYIYSVLLNPKIMLINSDNLLYFFSRSIPAYFFGRTIFEDGVDKKDVKGYIYIALFYSLLIILQIREDPSWYMSIAGNVFVPLVFSLLISIKWKNKIYYLAYITFLGIVFLFGSRGHMVSSVIATFLIIVLYTKPKTKLMIFGIALCAGIVLVAYSDSIINLISANFQYTRNLNMILSDTLTSLTGRDTYFNQVIYVLTKNPLKMNGIFADRIILAELLGTTISPGIYPHNIVLELLLQFGVIIGLLITVLLVKIVFVINKEIFNNKNKLFPTFMLILMISSAIRLLFSGSYLTTPSFWFLIGFYFKIKYENRSVITKANNDDCFEKETLPSIKVLQ